MWELTARYIRLVLKFKLHNSKLILMCRGRTVYRCAVFSSPFFCLMLHINLKYGIHSFINETPGPSSKLSVITRLALVSQLHTKRDCDLMRGTSSFWPRSWRKSLSVFLLATSLNLCLGLSPPLHMPECRVATRYLGLRPDSLITHSASSDCLPPARKY